MAEFKRIEVTDPAHADVLNEKIVEPARELAQKVNKNAEDIAAVDQKVNAHKAEIAKLNIIKTNFTILSANWIDDTENSGYWTYTITDSDVTEDSMVDGIIHPGDLENASDLLSVTQASNGSFTLFAYAQPQANLNVDYRITNQVGDA